ncbi:MAG: 16S rRNA (guanine(527)-N(7))-methyltransferase RsmG [Spirochaetes bacterium]|nr:16S rRNA (guanine(527)-N(7))-methyltransferase RsmG [Spirochaetota bacterium]
MPLNKNERDILVDGLTRLGVENDGLMIERFSTFIDELLRWNRRTNLVGTHDTEEIITRHILDSLSLYRLLNAENKSILDIGAGAGFPSIPLKIAAPSLSITLCERRQKRAAFLQNVLALLRFCDIEVEVRDVREVPARFDIVLARGVGDLEEIISLSRGVLKESGMIIAFKGKITEIEREMARLKRSQGADERMHVDIQRVTVPYLEKEERNIVIIQTK